MMTRQDKYENFFFVVDLHAITVPQDPKQLKTGVINAVATYLAAGVDPEKSKVFVQVPCKNFKPCRKYSEVRDRGVLYFPYFCPVRPFYDANSSLW